MKTRNARRQIAINAFADAAQFSVNVPFSNRLMILRAVADAADLVVLHDPHGFSLYTKQPYSSIPARELFCAF